MRTLWERPPAAMGRTVNAQPAPSPAAASIKIPATWARRVRSQAILA